MNKNLHAVILAGGSGTRFWPVSRQNRPKQFLTLVGKESRLRRTIRRVAPKVLAENVWIVANRRYQKEIKRHTSGLGVRASQILWEPKGKNTAPAIGWAAERIHARDPRAVMVVLPSDHLIQNARAFLNALDKAVRLARQDQLVTFGIVPTRPETGYGYLKTKKAGGILRVERFIEKPDLARAKQFVKNGAYLWNSGMFVWKTETILEAFRKYLPSVYASLREPIGARGNMLKAWPKLPAISIDYGILEKAKNVAAIAADIGWSDLGSWESLAEILPKDKTGNSLKGNVTALDCRNTLVWANERLVAAVGVQDMIVIDTPDALLVCPKHRSQDVKKLVEMLKRRDARVCY